MENIAQIEGLLFIAGDEGISVADLARITGFMKPAVNELLTRLQEKYQADPQTALTLLNSGEVFRLATKAELAPVMKTYFEVPLTTPLSQAVLEVLAIVAYKQPLTRLEIDDIRGVQSSGSLQKLLQSLADLPPLQTDLTEDDLDGDVFLRALQSRTEEGKENE